MKVLYMYNAPSTHTLTSSHAHTVTFPKPSSPLLDIEIIIGDSGKLSALVAAFEGVVSSGSFKPWPSLEWFQNEL